MNEIAQRKLSPVEVFVGEVLNPDRRRDVLRALPRGINPDRFEQSLSIAVMQNPALLKVHPGLVFREVVKASSLGLFMDPQLGEAYIVIVRNNRQQRDEPQLRVGYKGLMKLARQTGEIANIYAHVVYAKDLFRIAYGLEFTLIHEPWLQPLEDEESSPGPIRGVYAVVKYKNGDFDFEFMPWQEVVKIRDRSDGWRAFKAGKIKSTPWSEWPSEMARKTAIRRLMKRTPMSPDLMTAMQMVDREEEEPDEVDTVNVRQRRPKTDEALKQIANGTPASADEDEQPARKRRGRPPRVEVPEDETRTEEEEARWRAAQLSAAITEANDPTDADEDEDEDEAGETIDPETGEVHIVDLDPLKVVPDAADDFPGDRPLVTTPTNKRSEAYQRGLRDYEKGLTRCLSAAIKANPEALADWEAGQRDAKEQGR